MDGAMCPIGVVSLLFFHIYHIVNWPLNRVTKEGGRGGGGGGGGRGGIFNAGRKTVSLLT